MTYLNKKTIRMLELLDDMFYNCKDCGLWVNGTCKPYWNDKKLPTMAIIGEAPGEEEVNNEPFVGRAGKNLWNIMYKLGFRKEQFLIINSVNCRPVENNKNGKPTYEQRDECFQWINKYLKVVMPKKILVLGNLAMSSVTGDPPSGIISINGMVSDNKCIGAPQVFSVHPSTCIYKGSEGKKMLTWGISKFKELGL